MLAPVAPVVVLIIVEMDHVHAVLVVVVITADNVCFYRYYLDRNLIKMKYL